MLTNYMRTQSHLSSLSDNKHNKKWFYILSTIILFFAYSNTFHASWHFDDHHNITQNSHIQISSLNPDSLKNAALKGHSNRPVSNISLALNWYFGQDNVKGYHIVNLGIHIFTAFFLYLAIFTLFKTPNLSGRQDNEIHFIAFLAAIIWALNPIQTQAVTYIVQRMASMAALFYIMGIYFYLMARLGRTYKKKLFFYSALVLAFLLAVGSKENALMLPASIFLIEIIFFRDLSDPAVRKRMFWSACVLAALVFISGLLLFYSGDFISRLLGGYERRTFSLEERLLTQPRIILFYISLIFYPITDRLSLVHDFEISTGLFQPWTTLPAIMLITGMIATALWKARQYPLISFAVLFFFLNHVIESSVIALELVFEHRNYLPSFFLFVPVAAGIHYGIQYYIKYNKAMYFIIVSSVTILLIVLGIGTYVRNMEWQYEFTLLHDALEKAPGSARPYQNLANIYLNIGMYDKAEELHLKAIDLYDSTKYKAEVISLHNLAVIYYRRDKDYPKVIETYRRALSMGHALEKSHYNLAIVLTKTGGMDEAMGHAKLLLRVAPRNTDYMNLMAYIKIRKGESEKALPHLIAAIGQNPDNVRTLMGLGTARMNMGEHRVAEHYFLRISGSSPLKTDSLLLLIENSLRDKNPEQAKKYAEQLVATVSLNRIRERLFNQNDQEIQWPIAKELVAPVIAQVLKQQASMITDAAGDAGNEIP
ncbi:tetratricopeptide repeat protein [Desulfobotulus mexicanus]|uniref:Tetratricopeptide repeat protein n=1 Tax=Desulfobotulus mexicanus TaxID=2586642 RepID=A0A5Q4VFU4_9BACT|nr:tetratricopeptide repeat protein [Desulfobotulus mexicanus]TYT75828.1 tetratricopeptide repeat protein [Desulfobotulus mexicanus]